MNRKNIDTPFLVISILLVTFGTVIFLSTSLGLVARDSNLYSTVVFKQILMGLVPGIFLAYGLSLIKVEFWQKHAFTIFVIAFLINILIFVPGLSVSHGGATRWIEIGPIPSFQPSELLKIASVLCFAAWLSAIKNHIKEWRFGLLGFIIAVSIIGIILALQPDNDTILVISVSLGIMYFISGAKKRDIAIIFGIGIIAFTFIVMARPYVMERIMTLISSENNLSLTSGYQINQSLIAVGSGGIFGRGFGQSIQKFGVLPEPMGDSIFAVAGEEFGFIGTILLISTFLAFFIRANFIALKTKQNFASLTMVGTSSFIVIQSFINITSMVGITPISGIPLVFVSQGGTSLLLSLASLGIMFGISRLIPKH